MNGAAPSAGPGRAARRSRSRRPLAAATSERPRQTGGPRPSASRPAVGSRPAGGAPAAARGERPAASATPLPGVIAPPRGATAPQTPAARVTATRTAATPGPARIPAATSAGVDSLLIPEPPAGLSAADQVRLRQIAQDTGEAAARQEALPQPGDSVADARRAVTEPPEESSARAEAGLVSALDERPAPSATITRLCADIRRAIRERRPPDEDSLVRSNPEQEARRAGGQVQSTVNSEAESVRSGYDQMDRPPAAAPGQQGQAVASPPAQVATPSPNATRATPDAVPAERVSLDADRDASAQRMSDAGMDSPAAQLVQSGPIAEARSAQGELEQLAAQDPAQVLAEQQAARAQARADMATLERQALSALQSSRAGTVDQQTRARAGVELSEEQQRQQAATRARGIFRNARGRVEALLEPLPRTAMAMWETGLQQLSTDFDSELDRVERWKRERYAQTGGSLIELWDELVGLPDWVTELYDRAEREFGDGVCALLTRISERVNGVIAACEAIIAQANRDIAAIFNNLPANLQAWAQEQQAQFREQLNGLHERVVSTRDELTDDLAERGRGAVQEVRERIHELRQAAGGLVGRIQTAIDQFLDDPARFIINGLLELVGIVASAFWALVDRIGSVINDIANDPMGFANNLARAIGQGFQRFFDHFTTHILGGFFDWLFSGLGAVGVNIPRDLSPRSLITFFLELMGITWQRIRALLVRLIGERNVALIEQAVELLGNLIAMGPSGLFEMIKERLNPRDMIRQVIQAGVEFLVEALITRIAARLLMMFNPAGAIVQAIEVIYRILDWIFTNAARIFSLVETVVNGAAALIAGNITGMATAVEGALARLIAPVIDFLAGFLGLGNLPDRIADTIRGFQDWLWGIIERVIRALAERARALLERLSGRGRHQEPEAQQAQQAEEEETDDLITIPVPMSGQTHTLRIKLDRREVTLATREEDLNRKLAAGLEELAKYNGSSSDIDDRARANIRRMEALLRSIIEGLRDSNQVRRPELRELGRRLRTALSEYGQEFNVADVADGLPEFGPLEVGEHRVQGATQPDGSTRESHHVPPKELAQALAREMRQTSSTLAARNGDAAGAAADTLNSNAGNIEGNSNGNGLSAISLHRVTHQNSGGFSVHAAAMRDDIVQAIEALDRANETETIQIRNRSVSGDLAVNPSGLTFDAWVQEVNRRLDQQDADDAERTLADQAIQQAGAEEAALDQRTAASGRDTAMERYQRLADRAHASALTQGMTAVSLALRRSIIDGPRERHEPALRELRSLAATTWAPILRPRSRS